MSQSQNRKFTNFKHDKDAKLFFSLTPFLAMIAMDMSNYCYLHDQIFTITATVSSMKEDEKLKRQSDTHRTGRAIDLRISDWTQSFRRQFISHFNSKYKNYGALTYGGARKLIVEKSDHLHVQLEREFSVY